MSKNKYKDPEFNKLYNSFLKRFETEGDIYGSMHKSIEDDLQSKAIPSTMHKTVIHQILDEAGVEYFIKELTILPEETIIDEFRFK